jgi:hypothetical protein
VAKRRASRLVREHMEGVSARTLEEYATNINEYIRGRHGIYALYKGDRLYYVGLAGNLRARLKQHLRDRHHGVWNRFSVYLVSRSDHIRELEALVLRIVQPAGNKQKGKLAGSSNLVRRLRADIRGEQQRALDELIAPLRPRKATPRKARRAGPPREPSPAPLKAYVKRGFRIRGTRNGETYYAKVLSNGWIEYEGWQYRTPGAAATEAVGVRAGGWTFWKYQRSPGDWVPLRRLRDRGR